MFFCKSLRTQCEEVDVPDIASKLKFKVFYLALDVSLSSAPRYVHVT